MSTNPNQPGYRFEKAQAAETLREIEDARHDAIVLLERLGLPSSQAQDTVDAPNSGGAPELASIGRMLVLLASELCGNIAWYERAIPQMERREARQTRTVRIGAVVGAVIIASSVWLPAWLAFQHESSTTLEFINTGFWLSSAGLALVIALGLGQVFVGSQDLGAQRDAFWKARAALKEQLYTFENTWCGRLGNPDTLLSTDFHTALSEELAAARTIVQTERETFFQARATPTELLGSLQTLLETVLARGQEATNFTQEARATRAQRRTLRDEDIARTRALLLEEHAKLAGYEAGRKLASVPAKQEEYDRLILATQVELTRLQALLSAKLKAARLVPIR